MKRTCATLILVGLTTALAACGSEDAGDGSFTATGMVREKGAATYGRGQCDIDSSLKGSPQVVIKDSSGSDLAFGSLNFVSGTYYDDVPPYERYCDFSFEVANVPSGEAVYQVTIAGIEAPRATEDELVDGLSLSFD